MNYAQGKPRRLPDGFLHIQNFTVTKHSGMAGVVYTHVMSVAQREIVESLLIERAITFENIDGITRHHFKHGVWRFRKDFLKENFREVVHATTKVTWQPVVETFKSQLIAERESLTY
ncbi:hypothetical protein PssvBMR1_gp15 [Pseudomonas phage MR1]|uniref:Uncharacterized protein n=1 Tax=Pseudomonas phage MR1 TaxID=2711169 RepID=A0A6M3T8M4_9CAUD|nr:hypothetical protein PssvBMR1_gp15 [Pseudomonas phage MR1]